MMLAFIDDLNIIRVEFDGFIESITCQNKPLQWISTEGLFHWFKSEDYLPLQEVEEVIINQVKVPLKMGKVTLSKAFEALYRYDGPLGAIYTKDYTDFYVFSPVAKEIKLILNQTVYPMVGDGTIYYVRVLGDQAYQPYYYEVRLEQKFKKVQDPYLKQTNTIDGIVMPNLEVLKAHPSPINMEDSLEAIIYEGHVRDMTIELDVPHKGLFLGLTEYSDVLGSSVIEYIKELGMTHLQLLPVFDFEGVDPVYKDRFYNWGYNPKHFFAVQPWFSSQPTDANTTQFDFIQVINDAHEKGLGIIMDVVYNHVFDHHTYPYDHLVPGYFYRHDLNQHRTNSSYCGNDIETRNYMVRRLIIDSLKHFVEVYQIDGFRFDLMGLIDVDTMNHIQKALRQIKPNILLYGEGWHMDGALKDEERASYMNYDKMPGIAHFNDDFRNTLKGELHQKGLGFGNGNQQLKEHAKAVLLGSSHRFNSPYYSLNYVECHDNLTFYDKMLLDGVETKHLKTYQMFTNALIALSKGMIFYHAGQESFRTKQGVENSYKSPDAINHIEYVIGNHLEVFKRFIHFRKKTLHDEFHLKDHPHGFVLTYYHEESVYHAFVKSTFDPYAFHLKSCKLIVGTSAVTKEPQSMTMTDVGVYIFQDCEEGRLVHDLK
jgi:pullulanase